MKTVSERARARATESRLRAVYYPSTPSRFEGRRDTPAHYRVYNLTKHTKYTVSMRDGVWVCHCEGAKGGRRCKHQQRVMDREEQRTKKEALEDA